METVGASQSGQEVNRLKRRLSRQQKEIRDLRVENLFLKTLFDGIDEEILVIDREHVVKDVNRLFLEKKHLRKEEAIGRKCYEVIYRRGAPCGVDRDACPLSRAVKTRGRVEATHYEPLEKGAFAELIRIMYPLTVDGEGPDYFVEITRDVTEYRLLINKLRASEKKFRAILDTATDAVLSFDRDHAVVLFNDAAERIFGYKRETVLGKHFNTLIPPQFGEHYWTLKGFLEGKTPKVPGTTLCLNAVRSGGERFPVEIGLSHLEIEGAETFTAIIRDLSTQRQMEKKLLQSERLAAVGQAVAHVAHEIRNPLMIVGAFSRQIQRCLDDDKSVQKLDMILEEVRRLESLVENLLDYTKEFKLVRRKADVNAVVRDVVKVIGEIYGRDKYRFVEELCLDLEEINCDPDKLKQVFLNIIANAVEAMAPGGAVAVQTIRRPHHMEVRISDQGIGISEEAMPHIFDPFYTTRQRGSGLGLAISYRIIEAHGGEISAESRAGRGTTFYIRLPVE